MSYNSVHHPVKTALRQLWWRIVPPNRLRRRPSRAVCASRLAALLAVGGTIH